MIGTGRLWLSSNGIVTDGVVFYKTISLTLIKRMRKSGKNDDKGMNRKSESILGTWFCINGLIIWFKKGGK